VVRIAERIWPAWRAQADEFDEPVLLLLFSSSGDAGSAVRAVAESVREVEAAYRAEAASAGDEPPPYGGEWSFVHL
jgi:hypothetical protein